MTKVRLDPYLFFTGGKCREAMEFYKSVFGGELMMSTFADMGETDESKKDQIMHSDLKGGLVELMASDGSTRDHFEDSFISLSISGTDEAELRPIFDKLSEGGSKIVALKKESWGDMFGSFTDKFGVDWMMNIGEPFK